MYRKNRYKIKIVPTSETSNTDSTKAYRYPDKAEYNNLVYQARWWTQGQQPPQRAKNIS
ncbi:carbohydrate-binding protein [Pseudoalteromonas sp. A25]|uniref:carbohydrate-binding protein n=1 Tax=Pseudoalteromonas sp. A25 TaxID=116092 RepID=UPI001261310D